MSSGPIGIVVVNYAAAQLLRSTLAPVRLADAIVVVVDNFSSDVERADIAALSTEQAWDFVPLPDNRGFGPGVNAGVERALELGCSCVVLLNPDAEVTGELIDQLRQAVLADPDALVSPCLVDSTGKLTFAGSSLDLVDGRVRSAAKAAADQRSGRAPVAWLTAACLAVHRDLWLRVGGFDESYFMYWEDVDFSYRCVEAGAHLVLREDLSVLHDQGGTQGPRAGRAKSALYYYYNARNRMLFGARHLDRRRLGGWLVRTPKVSWEILKRGGRRQLLETPGRAWAAARGAAAGIAIGVRALVAGPPR